MSSQKPSRSSNGRQRPGRYFALAFVAIIVGFVPVFGALVTTDIYFVPPDDPITEDQYVTSTRAIIDGVIDGDLTVFTGDLTIAGEVTGNVQVMSSGTVRVTETGRIGGALRGVAVNVSIEGVVGSDVFVAAASIVVEESGTVERDVMSFGGVARTEGSVGRDVRGRTYRNVVTGSVAGDIDVASQDFEIGPSAVVNGDVLYRSPGEAQISDGAQIDGTTTRLPAQSNFIYGIVLSLANVVGLLAFLVAGIVILMLLRGTGSRATGAIVMTPIRTFFYGLAAVLVGPALVVVLAATLVGLPLAMFLAMLIVAGLVLGPVPAITAFGNRIMFARGGLLGAFVVGAVLWRLGIWLIPVVGGFLYLIALVWGIGGWIAGGIANRRNDPLPLALLPATMLPTASTVPEDWEPPLAPVAITPAPEYQATATATEVADEPRRVAEEESVAEPEHLATAEVAENEPSGRESVEPNPVPETPSEPLAGATGDDESGDDPDPPETDAWGLPRR